MTTQKMRPKKGDILFLGVCAFFLILFFWVKFYGPVVVENIYQGGNFETLNKITGLEQQQSFYVYLGYIEERFLGPISQVISGFLLILISLRYFKNSSLRIFGIVIFLYLLVTKFEVLFFPPYGETNAGNLVEALWLSQHSFDYIGLAQQKSIVEGGPKAYLWTIFPTFLAVLMKITPSVKSFIFVTHCIVFALSAYVISIFRSILRKLYNEDISTLAAIFLLSLPLYQSMIEVINMEMSCLFFAAWSLYYLSEKRIFKAALMAVLSAFVKGSGGIACGTVLVISFLIVLFDEQHKGKFKYLIWGILAFLLGFSKLILRRFVFPVQPNNSKFGFLLGWLPLTDAGLLVFTFLAITFGLIFIYIAALLRKEGGRYFFLEKNYLALIMFVFAVIWFSLHVNLSTMGPRYKLLVAPPLIFCGLLIFDHLIKSKKVLLVFSLLMEIRKTKIMTFVFQKKDLILTSSIPLIAQRSIYWSLIGIIFVSFLGSYGLYHRDKIENTPYTFNELERSLEYRNDLKLCMLLAETIEEDYSKATIGAPFVIAQILAIPQLGYVEKKLDIVVYGMSLTYGNIRNFTGLKNIDSKNTIWIGLKSDLPDGIEFPIGQGDKVIKEIAVGDKKATLFTGGFAIHRVYRMIMYLLNRKSAG